MSATLPTILLVDDDQATRFLVRRALSKLPLRGTILEAENGEQGLALVQAHFQACQAPGSLLVLLDLNMPVMDGLEFLEQYVQLPDTCQRVAVVIVISASPSAAERERAKVLAIEVKPKPIDSESLTQLVRQYLPAAWIEAS